MKYGYDSVKSFVEIVRGLVFGNEFEVNFDLPTFVESERVTAILNASDMSLANDS
jgi:hypothetical protein